MPAAVEPLVRTMAVGDGHAHGEVVAPFPQVSGADGIWFDPETNDYYLGANRMTSDGTTAGYPTPVIGVTAAGHAGEGHPFS